MRLTSQPFLNQNKKSPRLFTQGGDRRQLGLIDTKQTGTLGRLTRGDSLSKLAVRNMAKGDIGSTLKVMKEIDASQ